MGGANEAAARAKRHGLNDSIVLKSNSKRDRAYHGQQRKSIQSIANDDGVVSITNNESVPSRGANAPSKIQGGVTPKQGAVNRQNFVHGKNGPGKHLSKSPKLNNSLTNDAELGRPSPNQIQQMVNHREIRNNSQLAISNSNHGQNSIFQQTNMGMTKIHRTDASNSHHSTKWLPSVSQEKAANSKSTRPNAKTTKIQLANNEVINVTNQA